MANPISNWLTSLWSSEERFKELLAILIAVTTALTVLVGLLQNDASIRDDRANREAQTFALRALGLRVAGQTQVGYDRDEAERNWTELQTLAASAEANDDPAAARRYRAAAERIAALSPLLNPPYFDPASGDEPDIWSYEVDNYLLRVTDLHQRFLAKFAEKQAWDTKANTYVVHLTILAVSLFLFGLSTTIGSRARWVFVAAGLPITLLAVGWAALVYLTPVPSLPDQAIEAFTRGYGLYHRGHLEEAVAAFDEALAVKASYANASYWRGVAFYERAVDQAVDAAEEANYYQQAAASYEQTLATLRQSQEAGLNETDLKEDDVLWDLSWTYYVQGRFAESIQTANEVLKNNEANLGLRFNKALALLAQGQIDQAKAEYQAGLEAAAREVAAAQQSGREAPTALWQVVDEITAGRQLPGSLWWNLEFAANDLDALLDRLYGFQVSDWSQAPPLDQIQQPEAVEEAAWEIVQEIKSARVALETTGQPAKPADPNLIVELEAGQVEIDEAGDIVDFAPAPEEGFPAFTDEFAIRVGYEGMQDGQPVLLKLYYQGDELTFWRTAEMWQGGDAGEWFYPISYAYSDVSYFEPGEYSAEFYVDSRLANRLYFYVNGESE